MTNIFIYPIFKNSLRQDMKTCQRRFDVMPHDPFYFQTKLLIHFPICNIIDIPNIPGKFAISVLERTSYV